MISIEWTQNLNMSICILKWGNFNSYVLLASASILALHLPKVRGQVYINQNNVPCFHTLSYVAVAIPIPFSKFKF